jgi:NhaP-type Na+/H+ and K+/H+ antiporter
VTLGDLQRTYENIESNPPEHMPITSDICTRNVIAAHPEDVLWTAIRTMGANDVGRLPVVDEKNQSIVGIIRRHDIMDAYNMAIIRKLQNQHQAEQIRLNTLTGAEVLEYHIKQDSPLVGRLLRDIQLPPESLVASITRNGKLIVPHGNSYFRIGDIITVIADIHSEEDLEAIFK